MIPPDLLTSAKEEAQRDLLDRGNAVVVKAKQAEAEADAELLRASTVSRRLCVNVATVRRWIIAKKIAAITLPGGYYRIPASEVERIKATITLIK